jgi:hypothetical protein
MVMLLRSECTLGSSAEVPIRLRAAAFHPL